MCAQVHAGRFPVAPGASGFQADRGQETVVAQSVDSKFEPQPFHLLAGDLRHTLLKLLSWPQSPQVKEGVKMELITVPTSKGCEKNYMRQGVEK